MNASSALVLRSRSEIATGTRALVASAPLFVAFTSSTAAVLVADQLAAPAAAADQPQTIVTQAHTSAASHRRLNIQVPPIYPSNRGVEAPSDSLADPDEERQTGAGPAKLVCSVPAQARRPNRASNPWDD